MHSAVFKIVFDGLVDEYVRNKMDECTYKDFLSDINSNQLIGVKFYTRTFTILDLKQIAQIWTLNQDQKFNSLKYKYYEGAKLIIFVKSSNSSSVDQLLDCVDKAMINLNQIFLINSSKDFTEAFFEFVMVTALYNDELISERELKEQKLVYRKGNNPKYLTSNELLEHIRT